MNDEPMNQPPVEVDLSSGGGEHHWGPTQIVVAVVVIVILLALGFWLYKLVGIERTPSNEVITSVPEGDVVADFPQEFLDIFENFREQLRLDEDPQFQESYSVRYLDSNARQPVVRYRSKIVLNENVGLYATFFANNREWDVSQYADPEATETTAFYARHKDGAEVNVTFIPLDDGAVDVEIAYLVVQETADQE